MKSLKKRIQDEILLTDEDKLIFEIINEQSSLGRYERTGRLAYRRLVREKCNECESSKFYCSHKYDPIFTKDWEFRCFVRKEE